MNHHAREEIAADGKYQPEDFVCIIAWWKDENDNSIWIQDFYKDGEHYYPIFSDGETFKEQTRGSPYADKGVEIRKDLLASLTKGDELLILNPMSNAVRLRPSDLTQAWWIAFTT